MEDINLLLSFVETEIYDGKKSFMGGVVVNGENILNLVKRIRIALNEMTGQNLIEQARIDAERIRAEAEEEKERLLDENIVLTEAQVIAEKTVNDALAQRDHLESVMRRNMVSMLNQVKSTLLGAQNGIDDAIKKISADNNA